MKNYLFILSMCFVTLGSAWGATTKTQSGLIVLVDQGTGKVEFDAVANPSALTIKGVGTAPQGKLTISNKMAVGELSFDLNTFTTKISLRDKHMKEKYLEVEKFPTAKLSFDALNIDEKLLLENGKADQTPFAGIMSLHGVQKPVTGTAKISRSGGRVDVSATFSLKTSDFGIATPSFAGLTMGESVNVLVEFNAPVQVAQGK